MHVHTLSSLIDLCLKWIKKLKKKKKENAFEMRYLKNYVCNVELVKLLLITYVVSKELIF